MRFRSLKETFKTFQFGPSRLGASTDFWFDDHQVAPITGRSIHLNDS
jgi:hypothetical protein